MLCLFLWGVSDCFRGEFGDRRLPAVIDCDLAMGVVHSARSSGIVPG
jgi:hypothetical protein